MKKLSLALAAAIALPASANATILVNGSFEAGPAPGSFTTLPNGSSAITGWTVGPADIDYIGSYWQAADGSRSVDLSGGSNGSISQTFTTVIGAVYKVTFAIAANPDGPPTVKTMGVQATGAAAVNYTFDKTGHSLGSMGWAMETYMFTATSTSTTLTFQNVGTPSAYGPALDDVSVIAVPEPASWALMIGGFAIAGSALRRRQTARLATA